MTHIQCAVGFFLLALISWLVGRLDTNPDWLSWAFTFNIYMTSIFGSLRLIRALMEKKS